MQTLHVYRTPEGFLVDFTGTREEELIKDLFGGPVIVSSFTVNADPETVRAELQVLNPAYKVKVRA